jgi:hypothetical protein
VPATEQEERHLPVTTSHINLLPPFGHGRPVISHPPPPPSAAADEEFSVLRKVPRGPGHSPQPRRPVSAATAAGHGAAGGGCVGASGVVVFPADPQRPDRRAGASSGTQTGVKLDSSNNQMNMWADC